jgi:hypothetical protein
MPEKDFIEYKNLCKQLLKVKEQYMGILSRVSAPAGNIHSEIPSYCGLSDRTSNSTIFLLEFEEKMIQLENKILRKKRKLLAELNLVEDCLLKFYMKRYYFDLFTWREISLRDFNGSVGEDTIRITVKRYFLKKEKKEKKNRRKSS